VFQEEILMSESVKLKNLTPHEITVIVGDNMKLILQKPSNGTEIPRVIMAIGGHEDILVDDMVVPVERVPAENGKVVNLPEQEDGVFLVVSRLVMGSVPDRKDVLCPGPLVRDDNGNPVGCNGLSGNK
jgi:hypothetical protein